MRSSKDPPMEMGDMRGSLREPAVADHSQKSRKTAHSDTIVDTTKESNSGLRPVAVLRENGDVIVRVQFGTGIQMFRRVGCRFLLPSKVAS